MTKNTATKQQEAQQHENTRQSLNPQVGLPLQVIYADRITNVTFGPIVSKLTLGLEVSPNLYNHFANVVIPTIALLEIVEFLQKTINENEQLNTGVIDAMNQIKTYFERNRIQN